MGDGRFLDSCLAKYLRVASTVGRCVTPTRSELAHGRDAIHLLKEKFPEARWVAIGRKAESQLAAVGIVRVATVRHPARGGATEFAKGLADIAKASDHE